jgi:hypothetical protein
MSEAAAWGELRLEPGAQRVFSLGSLLLTARRTPSELWLRAERNNGGGAADEEEWTRWAVSSTAEVSLAPAVPDRLVVVSHEHPFKLPPRRDALVYVRIPLHARVLVREPDGTEVTAAEIPGLVLSDT